MLLNSAVNIVLVNDTDGLSHRLLAINGLSDITQTIRQTAKLVDSRFHWGIAFLPFMFPFTGQRETPPCDGGERFPQKGIISIPYLW